MPEQLTRIEAKLDELAASQKKIKTYLLISIMIPLVFLILPLLLIPLILPLLSTYLGTLTLPTGF